MSENPFIRFVDLVSLDTTIQSCLKKATVLDNQIAHFNKQKNDYQAVLDQAHQKVIQLQKNVAQQELEMKALDAKEQDKKNLLNTLFDYKECQAIKSEVDAIQKMQISQEKMVLDAWTHLESAQALLEKKRAENADLIKKCDDDAHIIAEDKQKTSLELAHLEQQREEKKAGIPHEWLEKYQLMGQRVSNPVVSIEQNSCSGCYQQLTQQDVIRARHGALMQCKKCFRLLYLAEVIAQKSA